MENKTVFKSLIGIVLLTLPLALVFATVAAVCIAALGVYAAVPYLSEAGILQDIGIPSGVAEGFTSFMQKAMIPVIIALAVSVIVFIALTADDIILLVCLAMRFVCRLFMRKKKRKADHGCCEISAEAS